MTRVRCLSLLAALLLIVGLAAWVMGFGRDAVPAGLLLALVLLPLLGAEPLYVSAHRQAGWPTMGSGVVRHRRRWWR